MAVNDEILDRIIKHQVYLERLKGHTANKLIALLNQADADLLRQLDGDLTAVSEARLANMLKSLREVNRQAYALAEKQLTGDLSDFAKYEAQWQASLLQGAIVVDVGVKTADLRGIAKMALSRPFQGRLLREWMPDLEQSRYKRIRDTIKIGQVEGRTSEQIVRDIKGTAKAKYTDGILDIERRHLRSVVRTAVAHTGAVTRDVTYADNADIVKAVLWNSTLDGRTTALCRARDGARYTVPDHQPIDGAPPYLAGPGRSHWGCRSVGAPVTKSYRELGIDLDEAPPGTRASLNGSVPEDLSYGDWLRKQDAGFIDETLGKGKGALFRKGKLSIDQFADRAGNEISLARLEELHPAVAKRAGLQG